MEKIKKLRNIFKRENIDGYLIPKNDEFFNEYLSSHNDRLSYISNFTGSYGFSLILKDKNYLFVDGRYSLQAFNQSGKFFKIVTFPDKMPHEILKNKKLSIGFDPKLFTQKTLDIFFVKSKCFFKPINKNLIDEIWKRKIKINKKKFYRLPSNSIGSGHKSKIYKIKKLLKKKGADFQFVTAPENSAWLLNIRGKDVEYTPIPLCFVLINKNGDINFFCDPKKIPSTFKTYFKGINFVDIRSLEIILSKIKNKNFILDNVTCSYYYKSIISKSNTILREQDPIYYFKAIKNKKEIENIKVAHIYDGVALTKYLFWVKRSFSKKKVTEISGSDKLLRFRKQNKKFKFLSFPTISGSGPNGAIIHYKADEKSNRKLKKGDLYLIDSGGQYEFGTTDVTRTITLGKQSKEIKKIFTRVLKGHIAVSNFKIKKNSTGAHIDIIARKYLNQIGLNYAHGTGHGVGYFLNVHEGPQAISKNNKVKFQEGMVVSNEPGYYEKNKFGIRIENLIYVKRNKNTKFFENLTMAPIDKDLIETRMLNKNEKKWLNQYHHKVFKNLKNFMNISEKIELKKACSTI